MTAYFSRIRRSFIMRRLPKGFGSVCKLSGNRRKPYAARVTVGKDSKGQTAYKYLGYYSTQAEAIQVLTDYCKNPYDVDQSKVTVADIWEIFKSRRFPVISGSGKNIYNAAYKHLAPIADIPIKDLRTYQLQSLIDSIDRSWQSKSHVQTLLHQMFDIAIELDIVQKNYSEFVKLGAKPQSDKHSAFTPAEIDLLFQSVFSEPWADTVLIMIYTGMRPSELLNVKIEDVHLNDKYIIGGMKTAAGKNRVIPISNKVMPFVLKRYSTAQTFLIEDKGKCLSYETYKRHFAKTMSHLGLTHLPHDGRHTFASLADSAGVNKVAVKLIMGHASNDITERVYTHKAIDELIAAVNVI